MALVALRLGTVLLALAAVAALALGLPGVAGPPDSAPSGWLRAASGGWQLGASVLAVVSAWVVRRRGLTARLAAVSAATILAAYGLWLAIVAPGNAELAAAGRIAPEAVPSVWALYRSRLEIGHAVGLALHLAGLIALLASVAVDRRGAG